jgi:hypothetical protein
LVLLTAWLFPSLLGPAYLGSREREVADPAAVRVIPLTGGSENAAAEDPNWVDASRAALQQAKIRLQVMSASVGPLKAESSPKKESASGEALFIRLRRQLADAAGVVGTKPSQTMRKQLENHRPRLTDNSGKVYPLRNVQEVAAQKERRPSVFPVNFQDAVLVFEAPGPGVENLRLEVPAEAWETKGPFRFTIPGSMIGGERGGRAGSSDGRQRR